MSYIDKYIESIEQSVRDGAVAELDFLTGFSGAKLLGTLQRAVSAAPEGTAYLEIGVFQGLSLVSVAAANPDVPCYGIDNFAFFDPENRNKGIVLERKEKAGADNINLIDMDYEDALEELDKHLDGRKIGVYFIDGPHDYRSQLVCLLLAKPFLHENAVILVDDSNYAHVRQANRDFIKSHPEYKLLFESYTGKHPDNMTEGEQADARKGWWDGINVIVRDPDDELQDMEPPTVRTRELYENDHLVQSMRYAHIAPQTIEMLSFMRPLRPIRILKRLARLWRETGKPARCADAKFPNSTSTSKIVTSG